MSGYRKWRDTDHLDRAVETAGGPEVFDDEVQRLRDKIGRPVDRHGNCDD